MNTSLISADLLGCINDLLNGARIEKVTSNAECVRLAKLGQQANQTRLDLEAEYKKVVLPSILETERIRAEYFPKRDALAALSKNALQASGAWTLEQQRLAAIEAARMEAEKKAEQQRLANLESKRLAEEEALRREAAEKIKQAEAETDAKKRAALIDDANTTAKCADIAAGEAEQAAKAVPEVKAGKVETFVPHVRGFTPKVKYSAVIMDYRAALKGIVDNGDYSLLESKAFKETIQSACNKIAERDEGNFKHPGCKLHEGVGGSLGTGNRRAA